MLQKQAFRLVQNARMLAEKTRSQRLEYPNRWERKLFYKKCNPISLESLTRPFSAYSLLFFSL